MLRLLIRRKRADPDITQFEFLKIHYTNNKKLTKHR